MMQLYKLCAPDVAQLLGLLDLLGLVGVYQAYWFGRENGSKLKEKPSYKHL